MKYIVGTRGSRLALAQTDYVIDLLKAAYPTEDFEKKIIKTTGDKDTKRRLDEIGSKGIFVKEIEDELLSGDIHLAVHSMKDMPDEPAEGLIFAKTPKRVDPRDVLILKNANNIEELPHGAVIGTGSKRRAFQLLKLRADIKVVNIRGNIDTRLRKLYESERLHEKAYRTDGSGKIIIEEKPQEYVLDGIVLAAAGLIRIGREDEITQYLTPFEMIPAPAQGALALELRADSKKLYNMIEAISDEKSQQCVQIEREFLKKVSGSCHVPVGAYCSKNDDSSTSLLAMFGTEDGSIVERVCVSESDIISGDIARGDIDQTYINCGDIARINTDCAASGLAEIAANKLKSISVEDASHFYKWGQ